MIPLCPEAVSCVVLRQLDNGNTEQLLVRRRPEDGDFWSHIGGGVEPGETAVQAIVRELHEETGLVPERLYNGEHIEQFYQVSKNQILMMPLFVAFVETRQQVRLNAEHSAYDWCDLATALARVPFAGQQRAYEHVWRQFVGQTPANWLKIPLDEI